MDKPAPVYLAAATHDGAVLVWSTGSDQLIALLSRKVILLAMCAYTGRT